MEIRMEKCKELKQKPGSLTVEYSKKLSQVA